MKRLLSILICLVLIGCPAVFAAAYDAGLESDIVYDWDELEDWLDDHWRTGGTVHLGANISVNGINSIDISFYASDKLYIETGEYGFIINRVLYIGANIEITGSGNETPVILVRDGGILHIDWIEYDDMALISVTGDGGTGLKLEEGASYVCGPWSFMSYKASGACSVAIDSEVYLELPNHYIDACGSGARGLVSSAQVDMLLSCVMSDGASITAPTVTLDTCVVSQEVSGATIINRKITSVGPRFYPHDPVPAGVEQSGYFANVQMFCTIILSAEGLEDYDIYAYVDFDDSCMDYDTPGKYYLPPQLPLPAPYDIFSFNFEDAPETYPVTVYDPAVPTFLDSFSSPWTREYVIRHIYTGDESLTLWRSDDEGQSWYVFWRQDDEDTEGFFIWADYGIIDFYISDMSILSAPAWFTYEVGEGKGSDVLYVDLKNMVVEENVGGDRDGGDRVVRPWEFFFGGGNGTGSEDGSSGSSDPNLQGGFNGGFSLSAGAPAIFGSWMTSSVVYGGEFYMNENEDDDNAFLLMFDSSTPMAGTPIDGRDADTLPFADTTEAQGPDVSAASLSIPGAVSALTEPLLHDSLILEPEIPLAAADTGTSPGTNTLSGGTAAAVAPGTADGDAATGHDGAVTPGTAGSAFNLPSAYTPRNLPISLQVLPTEHSEPGLAFLILLAAAGVSVVGCGSYLIYALRRKVPHR